MRLPDFKMEAEDQASSSSSSSEEDNNNNNKGSNQEETSHHHHHEFHEKNVPTIGAKKYREETKPRGWLSQKIFGKKIPNLDAV